MADESLAKKDKAILIYDAECRVCVATKEQLEQQDQEGGVRYVPYQSHEAACRLGASYLRGRPDSAFLVGADGRVTQGIDAFLSVLPGMRCGRVIVGIFKLPGIYRLAKAFYPVFARNRYRWFGAVTKSSSDTPSDR